MQDEVYNGNHNRAGEIGHMRLEKNGRRCYCGNYGCFDAYCNTLILKDAAGGELKDFFAGIDQGNREYERILTNMWKDSVMRYSISVCCMMTRC
mgnify:CR=1 FL=1